VKNKNSMGKTCLYLGMMNSNPQGILAHVVPFRNSLGNIRKPNLQIYFKLNKNN
jgi:hypothetical protein